MRFERLGDGPRPFLGLHGWGGGRETFRPLAPHLGDDVSFWSMELPGYGEAPAPAEWTPEAMGRAVAEGIVAVADEAGTAPTLVGNCSGAVFALLAVEAGAPAAALVMIDPFAYVPWYFRLFLRGEFGRMAYLSSFGNPIGRSLTNSALARHRSGDAHLTRSFSDLDHEVTHAHLRVLGAVGSAERFRVVERPVRLVHGERTFGAVRRSVPMWRAVWPDLDVRTLEGVGHLPIQESPEELAAVIQEPFDAGFEGEETP